MDIVSAVALERTDVVRRMIEGNLDLLHKRTPSGPGLLHNGSRNAETQTVSVLLSLGADVEDGQGSGTILTTGLAGKLTGSWTALGRFQYANTNYLGQSTRAQQGTAAMAVRPHASDRSGLLFSYTLTASDAPGLSALTGAQSQRVGILSSDSYLHPWKRLEPYQRFALSDRASGSAGFPTITIETYLSQSRAQFRRTKRVDTAIEARRLWLS